MPRATTDTTTTKRFELKSLPGVNGEEGGWIELRKLSYGQILERRDMASKIAMDGLDSSTGRAQEKFGMTIDVIQKAVTEFEFSMTIADHNLEDDHGNKLNFKDPNHVRALDPKIGQEIGELIDSMNQWDADLTGKAETTLEAVSEQV